VVKVNYKHVVATLYKEFGDQGIEWVKEQVETRLNSDSPSHSQTEQGRHTPASESTESDLPDAHLFEEDDGWYEDGDTFAAYAQDRVEGLASDSILSPQQVTEAVLGLVKMAGEVRKFEEAQVTKRIGIAAERDIAIAKVRAQQELLQEYLNRSFDERAENFTRLFAVVDGALDTNNMAALATGLESVVKLATSSPFKDLRTVEETAAALSNPDHEWDF
jgi:hypothetical protein